MGLKLDINSIDAFDPITLQCTAVMGNLEILKLLKDHDLRLNLIDNMPLVENQMFIPSYNHGMTFAFIEPFLKTPYTCTYLEYPEIRASNISMFTKKSVNWTINLSQRFRVL